jgi:hypothetical protein
MPRTIGEAIVANYIVALLRDKDPETGKGFHVNVLPIDDAIEHGARYKSGHEDATLVEWKATLTKLGTRRVFRKYYEKYVGWERMPYPSVIEVFWRKPDTALPPIL